MLVTEFIDSGEIHPNRDKKLVKEYADKSPYTDMRALQIQVRRLKDMGKNFDEVAHELSISTAEEARRIYG